MRSIWIGALASALVAAAGCGCQKPAIGAADGGRGSSTSGSGTGGTVGGTTGGGSSSGGGTTGGASAGDGGSACALSYASLALSPATSTVALTGAAPASIAFTVQGHTAQGASAAVDPATLAWSVARADDTNPGSIAAGVFTPYGGAGGLVTVTATGCGATGIATVTFTLDETVATDGGASADFAGASQTGSPKAPTLVYPSAETRFPRNVYKILFQWTPNGSSQFRLTFTGPGSTVTVNTDGKDPACAGVAKLGCWQADAATWDAVAGSNAGATVSVELDGSSGAGTPVYLGTPEAIGFSARDVRGAIFYWAANRGGIERATISDAAPEDYLVGNQTQGVPATVVDGETVQCAACHTVSRDGLKLAATVQAQSQGGGGGPGGAGGGGGSKGLWVTEVTAAPPPIPLVTSVPGAAGDGYATFSPDTQKLLWSPRNGGQLVLVDGTTGQTIQALTVGGAAVQGIAPDWSPDVAKGQVAFADLKGGISTLEVDASGLQFTNEAQLAAPIGGQPNAFPMFDPEGDEIAFTSNNVSLYLVPTAGGAPVELAAANTIVNNQKTAPSENSMPTWAPPGDLHWVAFNSQRPYGLLTAGGQNQIWVAAVDLTKLPADPSYPGFWLPFQGLGDKNHRAFWTLDVRTDYDGGVPDAGSPPDAGFTATDGGAAVDGGVACVALGKPCNPAGAVCCDPNAQGLYCGPGDAGTVCQPPSFQ